MADPQDLLLISAPGVEGTAQIRRFQLAAYESEGWYHVKASSPEAKIPPDAVEGAAASIAARERYADELAAFYAEQSAEAGIAAEPATAEDPSGDTETTTSRASSRRGR